MTARIFFAGGTKGPNARADGAGGFLRRGWYSDAREPGIAPEGPHPGKLAARKVAGPDAIEIAVLHRRGWYMGEKR